jgi:class 3 adenylate cyclase
VPSSGPCALPKRDPRDYTPKHLAEKILRSKSALEGERKQVTVLFADVKGSMELAEQVDPEEWHRILDRFFQILADGVHRFEGTVNQYTGDGIMALFGAPIAHEDHAQRAGFAALHLREELRRYADELRRSHGLSFAVRMGLNSGEVVVGKIGDDLRMDYTAQGQVVGLAARVQELAEPGRIYVTAPTAELVRGYFELRDLGAVRVKGAAEPLPAFELTAARAHLGLGDPKNARAAAQETLDALEHLQSLKGAFGIHIRLEAAEVLLAADGAPAEQTALRELQTASELIEETGAECYRPELHELRAELARALGDEAGRERELRESHRLYSEVGATGHARRLADELQV